MDLAVYRFFLFGMDLSMFLSVIFVWKEIPMYEEQFFYSIDKFVCVFVGMP